MFGTVFDRQQVMGYRKKGHTFQMRRNGIDLCSPAGIMKSLAVAVGFIFTCISPLYATDIDRVVVIKSEQKMYLFSRDKKVKEYHVVFGANPAGHKLREGDERTPEGKYVLDYKKQDSAFYRAIHISYPNEADKARAEKKGVSPGGQIMIHGQKNGFGWLSLLAQRFNWTNGCIAVTNNEMDEIWGLVKIGTSIEIRP